MTLFTIVYLIRDKQRFEDKMLRFTEVGSEVLLLFTSILIQELIRNNSENETTIKTITILMFTLIGILTVINIFNMIFTIVT